MPIPMQDKMEYAQYSLFSPLIMIKNWTEYKKQLPEDSEE